MAHLKHAVAKANALEAVCKASSTDAKWWMDCPQDPMSLAHAAGPSYRLEKLTAVMKQTQNVLSTLQKRDRTIPVPLA
jgi:hypothetical protein